MNTSIAAHPTRKVFNFDAFDSRLHDLLLSEMGTALRSEGRNTITACGVSGKKATLLTLQFEKEEDFLKVFSILEKYTKPESAELDSRNQEKVPEVKSESKDQTESGLGKTGNLPFETRTSRPVSTPKFATGRHNLNALNDSESSSVEDSSSITALTLTDGESSSSYTNGVLSLPLKNFNKKDGNQFNANSIPIRRGIPKQSVTSSSSSNSSFNPLRPVKIVRRPEKQSKQRMHRRTVSSSSESSSDTFIPQRSEYRAISVQRLNSKPRSPSLSDSSSSNSSGYCETCCISNSSSTIHFYRGVDIIIPQCSHHHFNSTLANVGRHNDTSNRKKSKVASQHQKPWLCF
ncbi:unnamed protein product [Hydatigera taeniaeformis]|uniref:DUF4476 domain-containing protein n=1 Tax=Hydatigena taeniaeformis TaxID=6205 RepID=A0A0R3XAQ7_HYDTA|nr:unnamed protein product [Hydatigera taeniaeformis]